jgi:hypothetical protein
MLLSSLLVVYRIDLAHYNNSSSNTKTHKQTDKTEKQSFGICMLLMYFTFTFRRLGQRNATIGKTRSSGPEPCKGASKLTPNYCGCLHLEHSIRSCAFWFLLSLLWKSIVSISGEEKGRKQTSSILRVALVVFS